MKVFVVACALFSVALAHAVPSAQPSILQDCFEKDSIACVQSTVLRHARAFFDQPSIELFNGVSFAKTNARASKSLEPQVDAAATVQERESALEDYLVNKGKSFFTERKLTWDVATTGRAIVNAIPEDFKEAARELITEGRTTKKVKLIKKLIPILGLVKLKLAGLAVLAVAAIGAIAKTALVTSFIALALAGAGALGSIVAKLFGIGSGLASKGSGLAGGLGGLLGGAGGAGAGSYSNGNSNVEEIIAYTSNGNQGWNNNNNGWSSQGWEEQHGSHSQPIGQTVAYSAHVPKN